MPFATPFIPYVKSLPAGVILAGIFLYAGTISGQAKIRVLTPKNDATVAGIEIISGKTSAPGQPFLLVRPQQSSGEAGARKNPWWIQKNAILESDGSFVCQVHFGNSTTENGTRFDLVAILVDSPKIANLLRSSFTVDEIPSRVVRSRPIRVILDRNRKPAKTIGFVTYPQEGDLVGRKEVLTGVIPKFGTPVVFVRAADGDGFWWTQSVIPVNPDGTFKSDLYFGNEDTPNKSRFQIAVVVLSDQNVAEFKKGKTLKKLPRDHLGLQTITVELHHEISRQKAKRGNP